jgi:predicted Zn-dependent peptidase
VSVAPAFPRVQLHSERSVLASGLRVVLRPAAANDIVAVKVYLPMGPRFEGDGRAGVSNLLQEMLLHGTLRRSEDELQDALADLGAKLATSVASDYGSVTLRVTVPQLPAALELLFEVLTAPALHDEEVAKEKIRVLSRIKAQADSLLTVAFELFRETFYRGLPFRKPVLGYPGTVRSLTPDDVREARSELYRTGRMIVAGVGNLDPTSLLARLETLNLPGGGDGAIVSPGPGVRLEATREVAVRRESQAAWMVVGFPAPSLGDPRYAAARLLDAVLGGSMHSRLFTELREKRGLAYQVSSYYNDQPAAGFLAGYIGTSPDKFEEARAAMLAEFRRLADERIPDVELGRAKSYLRGTYIISAETNGAQASRLGKYELFGLGLDFGDRWLERLTDVTAEDVRSLAEATLGRHVLAAVHPRAESLASLGIELLPGLPGAETGARGDGHQGGHEAGRDGHGDDELEDHADNEEEDGR